MKSRDGKSQRREEKRREEKRREEKRRRKKKEDQRRESQKKEDPGARKGSKVAKHCVFPMICGSGGLKSRLAKAAGAEPSGQMRDEKLHALVARSTFASEKVTKNHHIRTLRSTFGNWDVKKMHAAAARSTFLYKTHHARTTFGSWDVEKVHALGARSTFPSQNVQNTPAPDHFLKLRWCTPLWREAHFQVKIAHHARTTFGSWDVEKVHVVVARSTFRS